MSIVAADPMAQPADPEFGEPVVIAHFSDCPDHQGLADRLLCDSTVKPSVSCQSSNGCLSASELTDAEAFDDPTRLLSSESIAVVLKSCFALG